MRSQIHVQWNSHVAQRHVARGRQLLALAVMVFCLVGTATQDSLWAQPPGPPIPEESPKLLFAATQFPGTDDWLITGQLIDCDDPADILVSIDGAETTSATTDFFGYFQVLVTYGGPESELTADADYDSEPVPTAFCTIGT